MSNIEFEYHEKSPLPVFAPVFVLDDFFSADTDDLFVMEPGRDSGRQHRRNFQRTLSWYLPRHRHVVLYDDPALAVFFRKPNHRKTNLPAHFKMDHIFPDHSCKHAHDL